MTRDGLVSVRCLSTKKRLMLELWFLETTRGNDHHIFVTPSDGTHILLFDYDYLKYCFYYANIICMKCSPVPECEMFY